MVGMLYMKLGRNASGANVIPNVNIWTQLPSDIKVRFNALTGITNLFSFQFLLLKGWNEICGE
jgi:hypothetical protein